MPKPLIAVVCRPQNIGLSAPSLKKSFQSVGCDVTLADFEDMLKDIPDDSFKHAYQSVEGRRRIFAHAKYVATQYLQNIDCLAMPGNSAMIDPVLYGERRKTNEFYNERRAVAEMALVHVALNCGMPIIGICGGHHVIAVYFGGKLGTLNEAQLVPQQYLDYSRVKLMAESLIADMLQCKDRGKYFLSHEEIDALRSMIQVVNQDYLDSGKDALDVNSLTRQGISDMISELTEEHMRLMHAIFGKDELVAAKRILTSFVEAGCIDANGAIDISQLQDEEINQIIREISIMTFGGHEQYLESPPPEMLALCVSDDDYRLNESLETKHGAPVASTQWHPEVGFQGFPEMKDMYRAETIEGREYFKNLFLFYKNAAESYRAKSEMHQELLGMQKDHSEAQRSRKPIKDDYEDLNRKVHKNIARINDQDTPGITEPSEKRKVLGVQKLRERIDFLRDPSVRRIQDDSSMHEPITTPLSEFLIEIEAQPWDPDDNTNTDDANDRPCR